MSIAPNNPTVTQGGNTAAAESHVDESPTLIPRRVEKILLVASAYDSFMLEEYGLLTELIYSEYAELGLTHAPGVRHVTSGEEALAAIRGEHFDLVISTLRLGTMNIATFADAVHQRDSRLPVVLLIANDAELTRLPEFNAGLNVDSVYVWHGDAKLFLAIIKVFEDRWNVEHDTREGGVGTIILVEDSRRFRSSLLPIMYSELVSQTRAVMADGINRMHKLLRMRARPKILVAESFEEGMAYFERYREFLFGVIADVRFPRNGAPDARAGIDFIRQVKSELPDIPALLQSSEPENSILAEQIGASFLHKRSTTLLQDVRRFMLDNFGFGDFVFRLPDGQEVGRAADLLSMTRVLAIVPVDAIEFHARRNHFSNWLRARTEFDLARRLRPLQVSEFSDMESLRAYLITAFKETLRQNRRGTVEDFSRDRFDSSSFFARIGGGSLGGKARGLAFVDALLAHHGLDTAFADVRVFVPQCVVIGAEVFDEFLESNNLRLAALQSEDENWLAWAFQTAELPDGVVDDLRAYLRVVHEPLAVRSSSLFEDSQYYPLAGVYATHMIANNSPNERVRLVQLCDAVKLVYASTFSNAARRYFDATPHRIEEEKMAVILQPISGRRHERYFYPSFAGVALSYNYYPFGNVKPEDGVASVALGLGATVVDGGQALRFCPAHPQVLPQLGNGKDFIDRSQRRFYALDLEQSTSAVEPAASEQLASLDLDDAERHGTLAPLGSVWSHENEAFYDGIYREGVRVVTFAHVLKSDIFPLAEVLRRLLDLGRDAMNGPVEIEFAGNLDGHAREFAILQMRPIGVEANRGRVDIGRIKRDELLCFSPMAMGNGVLEGIRDIIYVKPDRFDTSRTEQIAAELGALNRALQESGRSCILIGPGRWGTSNRTLGIPVNWAQISSARLIVETTLEHFIVDPSQGSHFFHNLTSMGIPYLTVNPRIDRGFIDWHWLATRPYENDTHFARLIHLEEPLEARTDGRNSQAVVLKQAPDAK